MRTTHRCLAAAWPASPSATACGAFIAGYGQEALALYGSLGAVEERPCRVYRQGA